MSDFITSNITAINEISCLIYLFICSVQDIKHHVISLPFSLVFFLLSFFINTLDSSLSLARLLLLLLPGIIIFIISFFTKEAIGYGDAIVFMSISLCIDSENIILLIFLAFFLSSIFGLYKVIRYRQRKAIMPFVPFICISFLTTIFIS